jgi:DhnA family fructose-bisphosphate aldolase class Ia
MEEAERLPLPARLARLRELENTPQRRRKVAEALADVEKATELNPKLVEAQVFFAVHTDDPAKAIKAAKAACEAKEYGDEICLQLLAWMYARNGDFENAVHWQKKALELPVFGMSEAKDRLKKYQQDKADVGEVYWYLVR